MKIEVREEEVIIRGYVNAIERYSKPITDRIRGKIATFIERIKAGVFRTALKRNNDVKVLLNHDHNRVLASTKDGTASLEEDNIGLRAEVHITDREVVSKAKEGKLSGWSFGFYVNSDEIGSEGKNMTRTVTDIDLDEVSILDDTKSPAYYGTSIEARSLDNRLLEIRSVEDEKETEEKPIEENPVEAPAENPAEDTEKTAEPTDEEEKNEQLDVEAFAELVANKVVEKMTGTGEEKTIPEEKPVGEEESGEENRSTVDYSDLEKRIAKLN